MEQVAEYDPEYDPEQEVEYEVEQVMEQVEASQTYTAVSMYGPLTSD